MITPEIIRIGTRKSKLAIWQAQKVSKELQKLGQSTELVYITSEGDIDRTTPLSEMGGKGVFTKALDDALLDNRIDLAVHSYKDLPTEIPLPLKIAAVLKRDDPRDTLVAPGGTDFLGDKDVEAVIATGSNRRKAQWLNRYPNHSITGIRGNVDTRIRKVKEKGWNGAILAAAGLQRIGLDHHISSFLDWMIPAPAQGVMAVMVREDDVDLREIVNDLNDRESDLCTKIERDLLHDMEAGCSAPVGAHAVIDENEVRLIAVALTLDGSERFEIELAEKKSSSADLGHRAAEQLIKKGASEIIQEQHNSTSS